MKSVAVLALALAAGVISGASVPVQQRRRQLGGKRTFSALPCGFCLTAFLHFDFCACLLQTGLEMTLALMALASPMMVTSSPRLSHKAAAEAHKEKIKAHAEAEKAKADEKEKAAAAAEAAKKHKEKLKEHKKKFNKHFNADLHENETEALHKVKAFKNHNKKANVEFAENFAEHERKKHEEAAKFAREAAFKAHEAAAEKKKHEAEFKKGELISSITIQYQQWFSMFTRSCADTC
jgi:flagellar biosynthesis GTPase FlhF